MRAKRSLILALASTLLFTAGKAFAGQYYGAPPPYGYGDAEEALERRGFWDGVRGAEHDFENHRVPNVENRDEYRDPESLPPWARHEYREGFRRGYYMRVRQIYYGANGYGYWPRYWHGSPY